MPKPLARSLAIVSTFILCAGILASCSAPRYSHHLTLIMGVGRKVLRVTTAPTGHAQIQVLGILPGHLDVNVLSRIDAAHVLVSTYPRHKIYVLNTLTHRFRFLRDGWNAVYFPAMKDFVFLDNPHGTFAVQELWVAHLNDPAHPTLMDRGPFPIQMPVVPIAANAFVYSSWRKNDKQRLWLYNLTYHTFVPLPITGVYPELWLPTKQLLLCVDLAKLDEPYTLRTLQGKVIQHLALGNWYTPVLALRGGEVILWSEQNSSMSSAFRTDTLVTYDLETQKRSRVLSHTFAGVGTAFVSSVTGS